MSQTPQSERVPIVPLPLPLGAQRVLLFGGTFDPVHVGHVRAAAGARDLVLGPGSWLVFVPAARSPFKKEAPGAYDGDRLAMLELAIRGTGRSAIWSDELRRPAPSFWIDTVRRARVAVGPGVELRFLIGADAAVGFRGWREWEAILQVAEPVVMPRPPVRTVGDLRGALLQAGWSADEIEAWSGRFVAGPVLDASSTAVRERLAAGDPSAADWLDPAVMEFIRERRLYRAARGGLRRRGSGRGS